MMTADHVKLTHTEFDLCLPLDEQRMRRHAECMYEVEQILARRNAEALAALRKGETPPMYAMTDRELCALAVATGMYRIVESPADTDRSEPVVVGIQEDGRPVEILPAEVGNNNLKSETDTGDTNDVDLKCEVSGATTVEIPTFVPPRLMTPTLRVRYHHTGAHRTVPTPKSRLRVIITHPLTHAALLIVTGIAIITSSLVFR
jgi:hypothetical protein